MKILDISILLSKDMHIYPGDTPFSLKEEGKISEGKTANVSSIKLGTHTGTHIDPPLHFLNGSSSVDKISLDKLVGPAKVIDLSSVKKEITEKDLKRFEEKISKDNIVLLKTRNSILWEKEGFQQDYVYLGEDAAQFLVDNGVKTVGIDYLSIENFNDKTAPSHRLLLENNIPIVEGINLKGILPGEYFFACLPLKIKGGDGAPARAFLIEGL